MDNKYIKKFYNEICESIGKDYKIVIEKDIGLKENWIEYDKVKWEMEEQLEKFVDLLKQNANMNFEDKILKIYEYICLNYIYDANVLFFFRKDTSDPNNIKYIAVDWYGRIVDEKWTLKRKNHNRRICYEFARFYAKAINELIENNEEKEACIVGDIDNLHYVVGLTGKDYSVILDLDDFNSIKDLTRLKLGLTIKGIKILRDETGKLQNAIKEFNKNRNDELPEIEEEKEKLKRKNTNQINYFENILKILKSYNIDPQGIFEYMRSIIEHEDIEIEKLWKEVKDAIEKRYERCFIFNIEGKTYLMDSIKKDINLVKKEDLAKDFIFNPAENEYTYYGG